MIMFSAFFITFLQVIATKMSLVQFLSQLLFLFLSVVVVVFFFLHFLLFHIKWANKLGERKAACCKWA